ncbi:MAG: hypothetical protein QOF51_1232 [Chloroflexota bacterium]|jgi:hypothetical protein|nr:hypothetical protein [Chloroflexota bacterium]
MAVRGGLLVIGFLSLAFAAGFCFQLGWALALWPWPDTELSYIFIGSIAAAIGVPVLWVALTGEIGAAAAGALNLVVILGGGAVVLMQLGLARGDTPLRGYAAGWAILALGSLSIFLWSRRIPVRDGRPMPRLVRASFVGFAVVLVLVGVALELQAPDVLPWRVLPESSLLFGCIFLGPVVYFTYGAAQNRWHTACGQLLGFLAYDLVLIGPFLAHWSTVVPEQRTSLLIYIAVLLYSGALAVYFLFFNSGTRLWRPQPPKRAASTIYR